MARIYRVSLSIKYLLPRWLERCAASRINVFVAPQVSSIHRNSCQSNNNGVKHYKFFHADELLVLANVTIYSNDRRVKFSKHIELCVIFNRLENSTK